MPIFIRTLTSMLALVSAHAAAANDKTGAPPPTTQQILQDYWNKPLDYQQRLMSLCNNDAHAEDEACLSFSDVGTWGGRYGNDKVEVVPPETLPDKSAGFQPVKALQVIPSWTKDHDVVIVNEVHDNPETRLLPLELLAPLRKQGFDTLALEALNAGADVNKRGYPVYADGYYVREPIMARMIREAVRLGYHVVGYDVANPDTMDIDAREQAQARHLCDIVHSGKGHRVLVVAGLAHAFKQKGGYLKGEEPMAMRLGAMLGKAVFVIDQVYTFDNASGQSMPGAGLYVLRKNDVPWSARPGQFDVSIIARMDRTATARAAWIPLAPSQKLFKASTQACGHAACMVQAYRTHDAPDAVPLDASVADGTSSSAELMLPPGPVELRYTDANGKRLATQDANP